jgi:hypothetical protein
MSRKTQIRKPAGNKTWTMEIDPTNPLLASLTSGKVPAVAEHHLTNVKSNTEQHHHRGAVKGMPFVNDGRSFYKSSTFATIANDCAI